MSVHFLDKAAWAIVGISGLVYACYLDWRPALIVYGLCWVDNTLKTYRWRV